MKEIRQYHTATLLPNGKVLITGGISSSGTTATAICEIFDPARETWNIAASLSNARALHFATLLNDGRVFVAGGEKSAASPLNSCEIYDPISNQWTTSTSFFNQFLARAVKLSDGRILAITDPLNGDTRQTEIFDPIMGKWGIKTSFPSMRLPFPTTATLLPNGKVLVTNAGIECEIYRDQSM
ncbi:MAG: Kelch repeat-containing protein [bacterium]